MKSKSLKIVNLTASILWVLLYDFEKAKVDFKKYDFEVILAEMNSQKDENSKIVQENKILAKTVLQLVGK